MFLISDLCAMLDEYLESEQVREVYQAYLFGAEAHEGQRRMSGEPYIYHPLAVARILAEMHLDHQTIIAAILHDVIEDTPTAKEQLVERFGKEIAELVDGVSKLTHIEFESKAQAQAENFRKMMLAMVQDMRVILIKLADRLHNMRTLGVMRPDKKRRIAKETLEIYVPIATRLGLNRMRLELEDLGFASYYPNRAKVLTEAVKKARGNRREVIKKIQSSIQERLRQEGLPGDICGREKHLYSIYLKMRNKHLAFSDVMDVFAFRIVVDKVDTCYRVLGAIHNLYKPVPGKFKDYIAIPKANGYQSLHTALLTPYGFPIEVQIRTVDMETVAEAGIASHWQYKTGTDSSSIAHIRAREWLKNLLEMQQRAGDSLEFLENVKVDLFPDEVYVFTPTGDIMELPRGATAVDFAFAVHTDVGNSCVAAKVNRRLVPLHTELRNGQSVEIITSPGARPNPTWLNFVVTGKARATIRNYLKNMQQEESITLGRRLLERALSDVHLSLDEVDPTLLSELLGEYGLGTLEALLEQIGLGNRVAPLVARALSAREGEVTPRRGERKDSRPLAIQGTEGTVVQFAKCCRPIPGDRILGLLTAGRGIVIHTRDCKNVAEFRKYPEKWIDVQWSDGVEGEFPVDLRIEVNNQRGVLAIVAAAVAETQANIDNISLDERDGLHTTLNLTVSVTDRRHLARIIRRLRAIEQVLKIIRR
ncbi:MAG: bifunctional GTP diphosphokinase/guanosine-3',5'-bis pyrophosphate 3'-pyrophosphohydrolase [Gammaproteobacteria bacterium]|nr:bifunctional GTP diphosphokinase/guanosine-3',5'-bis pyrophosphate 3'-pyrophosphohydrolase [Gammaproteobacteria bacterium]MCW8840490.1 bifunctional GTP diphosphokinase/guanosine-3',5'-bis pyrophosphate 3'-pyrophosphohydrolase [Gammaproteobacteria bacterium]MCW8959411.1 bifunctional GTP diphosphokinase/guanosine-3',5'-bis pyrophosphate 3'-pyrophosphohydrolase [Gammaproteobacteria bacterium]MCW8973182.1 bifunctional GTP diphosphokinase/guanosine-3',5'-bis pyrophosphate 3'-pyrophosphohydrolase [